MVEEGVSGGVEVGWAGVYKGGRPPLSAPSPILAAPKSLPANPPAVATGR